jgi:hypothetical protein
MAIPIIDTILGLVNTAVDKIFPDKTEALKVKGEIEKTILQNEATITLAVAEIIKTEAQGGWLQRNWRPLLMLTCIFIVANNYILYPYIILFGGKATVLELPEKLWNLMTIGVGGYVVGRSAEKIIEKTNGKGIIDTVTGIFKK